MTINATDENTPVLQDPHVVTVSKPVTEIAKLANKALALSKKDTLVKPQDKQIIRPVKKSKEQTMQQIPSSANLPIMAKDRYKLMQLKRTLQTKVKTAHQPSKSNHKNTADEPVEPTINNKQNQIIDKNKQKYMALLQQSQNQVAARQQAVKAINNLTLNEDLPVSQAHVTLIDAIKNNQVIIVAGETGSGKTTQLPKMAIMAGRGITGIIGHTQPRRLAARSVSERIAFELGEGLGKTVGFKVRFNESGDNNSIIRLMTDGILLAELAHDRFLTKYDTIIIDEAHERSLNIDFLLGYIKQTLPKRPDLKVIITSATLDVERFSHYFNQAPIFNIEGRSYPVEVRYRPLIDDAVVGSDDDAFDEVEENLPRAVVAAVEECYQDAASKGQADKSDILIFASTEAEIRELQEAIIKFGPKHTEVLPLYARLALAEQNKIFNPSGKGRRIIIATNVAETALTVPNIRYVIDTGFARLSRYSYRSRVQRLPIEAISQASANQRKGRCGRIAAGVCIRLYSEADFLSRAEFTQAEIKRTNLASVILQMAHLRLGSLHNFDFIDPPDSRLINDGIKLLVELGAMDEKNETLTKIGEQMATMPIDPRLSRMILAGAQFGVLTETLIIVSSLAVQDPRERPVDKQTQADQAHALFRQTNSDFLFFTTLWQAIHAPALHNEKSRRTFARQHFLSWLRLREWKQTHSQLLEMATALKLNLNQEPADFVNLHRALLVGLLSFIGKKTDEKNEYQMVRQQKAKIFPASILHKQQPPWVMAFEMVETSQVWLRVLAKIEPEWIIGAAKHLLKYHYFEPHWSKKAGQVKAYAQISLFGLIIQSRELCNYEPINAVEAREIFIREALVTGNLGVDPPFLKHNLAVIENVQRIEDKLRRRDLLVDDETLYQFYEARLAQGIANRKHFEDWRIEQERNNKKLLWLSEADILALDAPTTQDFPDQLQVGQLKLPTRYVFNPTQADDGAVLTVPVQALPQIDPLQLAWGIMGWRKALLEALLKSLPKDLRRRLVPIPDTVQKILPKLDQTSNLSLPKQIIQALQQHGINTADFTEIQFDFNNIPEFLRPTVEVVDERKKVIAKGRDVAELRKSCISLTQTAQKQTQLHESTQSSFKAFPERFNFESNHSIAGVSVSQYQALVPDFKKDDSHLSALPIQMAEKASSVHIAMFSDKAHALQMHRQGILSLCALPLAEQIKQLKKQINKQLILMFMPLGSQSALENLVIHASLDACFNQTPLNKTEFETFFNNQKVQFLITGQQILKEITDIFTKYQTIKQQMVGLDKKVFGVSLEDINIQLKQLHLEDFVYRIDVAHWREYPRYLTAMQTRLTRLPHNLAKDEAAVKLVATHQQRIETLTIGEKSDYRWLVEEYRISLFAQPMKTKIPVSDKRLDKVWEGV